ncbi:MAG TPA: NAD(P)-dependent oxidoreductase [Kiritimatiellia bacterium]|nr:NAD(P)-dependent oxidoreductase [Kiritimatiellia bacterium]
MNAMKFDVFFYEAFEEERQSLARLLDGRLYAGYSNETIQRSGHTAPPAALISIRTQSALPAAWIPGVRGLLARTTGSDHLEPLRLLNSAPALACLPEYCSRAVAEQAALLWMALLRKLPRQLGQWSVFNRDDLTGGECLGRTLGVIGVGRIGREITQIGRGLGMNVLGVDPVRRHPDVNYVELSDAVAQADILVASMNLTPENRGVFNYDCLRRARAGLLFINVARGELAVASDLARLLDEGTLGGLAMDVFDGETRVADALRSGAADPEAARLLALARRPNVLFTPHNAFNTSEALDRKSALSIEQAISFAHTGQFKWPLPN